MVKDKINKTHQVAGWNMKALRNVSALVKSFIFKQQNCKSYKLWKIKFKVFKKIYLIFGKYVVSSKNPVKGFSCGSLEKLCLHSQNSSIHQFG